jgi:Trk K+ transport system NAD-binding subunit
MNGFIPRPLRHTPPRWQRRLLARWRDTRLLLQRFRGSLIALAITVIGGGTIYFWLSKLAGEPRPVTWLEGVFLALAMIFLQANADFPSVWYLALFFFIMPVVGFAILSQGIADIGVLLFNRQARGEAWQVAVASTYSNHIVIVGLGHLGFRVARALHDMGEDFVVVESDPEADLLFHTQGWDVPVIRGDASKHDTLQEAGVDRAHTVVIVTSDDALNLQIAIHARAVNPNVRTIVRLFDDDFSREVSLTFGLTAAYSASALAAPAFAAAAANLDLNNTAQLGGQDLNMANFTLHPKAPFAGKTVGNLEVEYDVSIVAFKRGEKSQLHPTDDLQLKAGDQITVLANSRTLHKINRLNR